MLKNKQKQPPHFALLCIHDYHTFYSQLMDDNILYKINVMAQLKFTLEESRHDWVIGTFIYWDVSVNW